MARLGLGRLPTVMPHYDHFLAEDVGVWSRFLQRGEYAIDEVWYDVKVGAPISQGNGQSDLVRKIGEGVGRKRIDCVCRLGADFWVVEVKPYAGMLAVGQVSTYVRLFVRDYEVEGDCWGVIICDDHDPDLLPVYADLGVMVISNEYRPWLQT